MARPSPTIIHGEPEILAGNSFASELLACNSCSSLVKARLGGIISLEYGFFPLSLCLRLCTVVGLVSAPTMIDSTAAQSMVVLSAWARGHDKGTESHESGNKSLLFARYQRILQ